MANKADAVHVHDPETEVHRISRWIFNCYVVPTAGGAMVVDAGIPSNGTDAAGLIRSLGIDPDSTTVVATHAHSDHVSGAPAVHGDLKSEVWLPAKTKVYHEGGEARSPGPRAIAKIVPVMRSQPFSLAGLKDAGAGVKIAGYGRVRFRFPFEPHGWLTEGDHVAGSGDWTVINTPGHTDDSISFYSESTKTLFSGDAVLTAHGKGWFNPEFVDEAASATTEARLRALDVEHLYPGHGLPVHGDRVMERALSFRDKAGANRPLGC